VSSSDLLLKAKIKNVGEWKAVLSAIKDITPEAMFIYNNEGITFRGLDPAHVALMEVTFPKSSFEELETTASFFGLNVEEFKSLLDTANNEDTIRLEITKPTVMEIIIEGSLQMNYVLRLIERSEVNTPIPKIDVKSTLSISPQTLTRIVTNLEKVSDHMTITSVPDKVEFSGVGDISSAKIGLDKQNPEMSFLDVLEESTSMYSLEYMARIIRSVGKASKNVSIKYGTKLPIHLLFEMPSFTKVEYYLAPRIEN
jgi:proliferating cell nuclear antigen